jgi:hypothetical protein
LLNLWVNKRELLDIYTMDLIWSYSTEQVQQIEKIKRNSLQRLYVCKTDGTIMISPLPIQWFQIHHEDISLGVGSWC